LTILESEITLELWNRLSESAKASPDQIALEDSHDSLTFSELLLQVEQFAWSFSQLQVQFGYSDYVPIFVARDLDSSVAVLSCYLFRLPFVPVDVEWPSHHVELILSKLGWPKFSLAGRASLAKVDLAFGHISKVNSAFKARSARSARTDSIASLQRDQTTSGLVLFTSGTTGTPKGVEWDRKALDSQDSLLIQRKANETISPLESLALLGFPLNWTAGIYRLLGVTFGERVRLLSVDEMAVRQFIDVVQKTRATTLRLPASLLVLLSDLESEFIEGPTMPSVKSITTGGDALSFSTIYKLKNIFPDNAEFQFAFGATEATSQLKFRFLLGDAPKDGQIPIGDSNGLSANMKQYLDQSESRFVFLARGALAKGYLGDPDLTERRFLTDRNGERYWLSGDIFEVDASGRVWHKGRVDDLVKIHGKLTSPSDAREVLQLLPEVKDAVVLAEKKGDTARLVAHVIFHVGRELSLSSLRSSLATSLPPHSIPTKFIAHQSLPKTPQGKPDRATLLSGDWKLMTHASHKAPRTNTEMQIASNLEEILGAGQISVEEDLIEAGLDSMAALELEVRLQKSIPLVTMDLITSNPTVRSLSSALDRIKGAYSEPDYTLNPNGKSTPIFAFPGDGGHITQLVHLARELGESTPVVVLLHNQNEASKRLWSIEAQVSRALKLIVQNYSQPYYLSGYSLGGVYAYELAKALVLQGFRVNLTVFDTSFSYMTPGGASIPFGRLRLGSALRDSKKKGVFRIFSSITYVLQTHGLLRAGYMLLVSQPLAIALSTNLFRKLANRLLMFTAPGRLVSAKATVTKAFVRHEIANYSAIPIAPEVARNLQATFVYTDASTNFHRWTELIPNISFLRSSGTHTEMLKPPHVQPMVESLKGAGWRDLRT
jgi:acyl-CoA synthetase (AMP-forming)/AMP-acid ligase II/thioesterase domain-containing protein/aryl carrier-like protein